MKSEDDVSIVDKTLVGIHLGDVDQRRSRLKVGAVDDHIVMHAHGYKNFLNSHLSYQLTIRLLACS